MPFAYELHAGDVVVVRGGDVRQIQAIETTSVDQYPLLSITFTDGSSILRAPTRVLPRVHPPEPAAEPERPVQPVAGVDGATT